MAVLRFTDVRFGYRRWRRPEIDSLSVEFGIGTTMLLGPNGVGKSTLLGLGASALHPRRGEVWVDGTNSRRTRAYRALVSISTQRTSAVPGCNAREQVALAGWLKGQSRANAWVASAAALDRVGLGQVMGTPSRALSGGQLARVGLAEALAYDGRVVLLDEPMAELDPSQRRRFRNLVAEIAVDRCVVVSTHDVADLTAGVDHVVVMGVGRLTFSGPAAEFLCVAPTGDPVSAYEYWVSR